MGAIPYGQEISVTALQMLSALNSIANDGVIMQPFVVKRITDGQNSISEFTPCESRKPMSARTAQIMKNILIGVVENGTGQKARVDGYTVAGKTGTSQKASDDGNGYIPGKYVSSFVGFLPAEKPLISIIVVIDEPQGEYSGSVVTCPIFKEIATQIMQYLTAGQGICVARVKPAS
jgi:cell division protein FtsI (penicillin-binding protein 3)